MRYFSFSFFILLYITPPLLNLSAQCTVHGLENPGLVSSGIVDQRNGQTFKACQNGIIHQIKWVPTVPLGTCQLYLAEDPGAGVLIAGASYQSFEVTAAGTQIITLEVPFAVSTGVLYRFEIAPPSGQAMYWESSASYTDGNEVNNGDYEFYFVLDMNFEISVINEHWDLGGNAGSDPGTHALGTIDDQDLVFKTNSTEILRMKTNGNVGMGTTTPKDFGADRILEIMSPAIDNAGLFQISNADRSHYLRLVSGRLNDPTTLFWWSDQTDLRFITSDDAVTNFSEIMRIKANGNVGIGTDDPLHLLHLAGDLGMTGTIYGVSDQNIKTEIKDLKNAHQIIQDLSPRKFKYETENFPQLNLPMGVQFGLIAQEVEKVLPEIVTQKHTVIQNDQGENVELKGINYQALIPILLAALKEQQEIIDGQQFRIAALEKNTAEIELLKSQMQSIVQLLGNKTAVSSSLKDE